MESTSKMKQTSEMIKSDMTLTHSNQFPKRSQSHWNRIVHSVLVSFVFGFLVIICWIHLSVSVYFYNKRNRIFSQVRKEFASRASQLLANELALVLHFTEIDTPKNRYHQATEHIYSHYSLFKSAPLDVRTLQACKDLSFKLTQNKLWRTSLF